MFVMEPDVAWNHKCHPRIYVIMFTFLLTTNQPNSSHELYSSRAFLITTYSLTIHPGFFNIQNAASLRPWKTLESIIINRENLRKNWCLYCFERDLNNI